MTIGRRVTDWTDVSRFPLKPAEIEATVRRLARPGSTFKMTDEEVLAWLSGMAE